MRPVGTTVGDFNGTTCVTVAMWSPDIVFGAIGVFGNVVKNMRS